MIAKMLRVHVASSEGDRDRLLEALRRLGVVHLQPVDPKAAQPPTEIVHRLDQLRRAAGVLEAVTPAGAAPEIAPAEAAAEVAKIVRDAAEAQTRLAALHRSLMELQPWGNVRIEQFRQLQEAGLNVEFFWAGPEAQFEARHVQPLEARRDGRTLTAVVNRDLNIQLDEHAEPIPLPATDRAAVLAEAAEIDGRLRAGRQRLAALAHLAPAIRREILRQEDAAAYLVARQGGLIDEGLYALQGWVPAAQAEALPEGLITAGIQAAAHTREAFIDEEPPTLIEYPRWVRPIKGLFDILATVPGYREFDVSAMFMIALPLFSAILIGDAGYGLVFLLLPAFLYRRMAAKTGPELPQLIMIIGATSLIWGVAAASFFGFDMTAMDHGGVIGRISWLFQRLHVVSVTMELNALHQLMALSFTLGLIQLAAAHLMRARANFPHPRFLGNVGWAIFLFGMYGVVRLLVLGDPFRPVYAVALILGGAMAIVLADPQRNMLKAIGLGVANFPLSAISTFGDTVSYVRLMAIGLAGGALAAAFNDLGARTGTYLAYVPILVVGHALNVGLCIVSLFAHGVRLNMLEFSNNLGMQWSGYAYSPFKRTNKTEET